MQTILGAGGAVGSHLAKELLVYTDKIRLASRNPQKVNESDELFTADLTDAGQLDKAVEGSNIVYVTVGFKYNRKVWEKTWPPFIKNVIDSCSRHSAWLVFFDNVYMYDPNYISHMTEETPVRPSSRKGKVREQVQSMILEAVESGKLKALIARSADFYGLTNSVLIEMVPKNLMKEKKANWFADLHKIHNFTFIPDAARATAILGNTPEAYGQVWHLPTDGTKLTGKQWVELFSRELNVKPAVQVMPVWMMGIAGLFMPIIREFKEMVYQYEQDYFFDSSKFTSKFGFKPVSPGEGIKRIVEQLEEQETQKLHTP
ncbi:MAG TPA: NAD-dependent epimerase/dehydratase family protein [Bacteroidales bacterium]|nr:NAD-dependent epimerase/dehydratase family protein [Bacteroidales bacterium]